MSIPSFCSISDIQTFLQIENTASTSRLSLLNEMVTADICAILCRGPLTYGTYTERFNGSGSNRIMLKRWPVLSVNSLIIDGKTISAATGNTDTGYFFDSAPDEPSGGHQSLYYRNGVFPMGTKNIVVNYSTGYSVLSESQTISSTGTASPDALYGPWRQNISVTYSDGTAMTEVSSDPEEGQYAVSDGDYTFSTDDAGQSILISYDYTPDTIRHAAIEVISETVKYSERIGVKSRTMNGVTTDSYDLTRFRPFIETILDDFIERLPV